jgi:hypothetical protein
LASGLTQKGLAIVLPFCENENAALVLIRKE